MSPICSHWTALVDTVAEPSLVAKKNLWPATAVSASLSSAPVSLTVTWVILPKRVQTPPWPQYVNMVETGDRIELQRDTYLIYCLWSDCTEGLGLAGNSHVLLLFFIIFHQGHLQLTASETLTHILIWIIHLLHIEWCLTIVCSLLQ